MAEEEVSMIHVDTHASEDEIQSNPDEIIISFYVEDASVEILEPSMMAANFRVPRHMLINSPTFVSHLLSLTFPFESFDNEFIQSISLHASSMTSEYGAMIVCISFEPIDDTKGFALEKVNEEDLEAMEECVICLEGLLNGSEVSRMSCSHIYHRYCIVRWLEKSNSCPLCRYQMTSG